eukprot:scaffold46_cov196-Ochromonas_danica.AAC.1
MSNLTRSNGAAIVLATAPDRPPARKSVRKYEIEDDDDDDEVEEEDDDESIGGMDMMMMMMMMIMGRMKERVWLQ